MTDDRTRRNLIEDLTALAARIPDPPPIQRLEAGPAALERILAAVPKADGPPDPLAALTGIPVVKVGDPPPDSVGPLPPDGWRLIGRDGLVLSEGRLTDGE